jgi:uncharacterized membrane protein YgcG
LGSLAITTDQRFASLFSPPAGRLPLSVTFALTPKAHLGHLFFEEMVSMAKKLYVGNLAWSVTNDALEQLFSGFGTVTSAQVVQDRETGRSRGFGFVEIQEDDAAQRAIDEMHDKEIEGRRLTVNEAKPREGGGGGRGGYGGGGGGGRGGYGGGGGGRRY